MTKHFVDSNILISYFLDARNSSLLDLILEETVFINDLVMVETLNFIQNRYSCKYSILIQKQIEEKPEVFTFLNITKDEKMLAWDIRQKYADNKLSYVDSIILAQVKINNLTVLTQDKAMLASGLVQGFNPLEE